MPVYEYQCQQEKCQHNWEVEQRIIDAPLQECPKCQQASAKKLISVSSFALKGGGWASTGYS